MTQDDIIQLTAEIRLLPQFSHYQLSAQSMASFFDVLADLPMSFPEAWMVVLALLLDDPRQFPTPQDIRRRFFADSGLLALPWADAILLVERAFKVDTRVAVREPLPYPLREAVEARGGLDAMGNEPWGTVYAQLLALYATLATRHNQFVMAPGGVDRFKRVCEWVDAVESEQRSFELGRWVFIEFGIGEDPGERNAVQAKANVYAYFAEYGEMPVVGGQPPPRPQLDSGRREAGSGGAAAAARAQLAKRKVSDAVAGLVLAATPPMDDEVSV